VADEILLVFGFQDVPQMDEPFDEPDSHPEALRFTPRQPGHPVPTATMDECYKDEYSGHRWILPKMA
jgi:hypothetical protein